MAVTDIVPLSIIMVVSAANNSFCAEAGILSILIIVFHAAHDTIHTVARPLPIFIIMIHAAEDMAVKDKNR